MAETVNQETTPAAEGQQTERTFTQAEMNAIIADRLNRERTKYADYDTLKSKAAQFDAAEEASKSELQKANEKAAAVCSSSHCGPYLLPAGNTSCFSVSFVLCFFSEDTSWVSERWLSTAFGSCVDVSSFLPAFIITKLYIASVRPTHLTDINTFLSSCSPAIPLVRFVSSISTGTAKTYAS